MIFKDISHTCFKGADFVVGIVAGVDVCDLSVIIIKSLSKNYMLSEYGMIVNLVLNKCLFKKLI